ncbi:DUF975 family protein [Intestinibacter sp.]|uniref:DUF975 family protein n=1 Tax=Intestinibacter sp. TaxID=1965304 RepID=UPI003F184203
MKKIDKSPQKIDTLENQDINLDLNYEDIDETNKIAEVFEKMRVNLKDAFNTQLKSEKEKQDIIQSLSHDLRSPLTLIKGHVELLQSGAYKNEERLKRYLNVIEKSTNRAVTLVDDLNVLSKIDDSDFILDKKEVLLNDFIKEKFEDYKTLAKEKHLKFYVNVDSELSDAVVYIDKSQISRVVDNIITNSFRYVDEGGSIEVDISQSEQDKVVFKIKDSGAGFSKEDLPNVFNRFYKGDKSRANSSGNSGLGLYICKKIIDKHSGEIRVFNENGAVVEFSIWKKKVMKTKEIKKLAKRGLKLNLKPVLFNSFLSLIPIVLCTVAYIFEEKLFVFAVINSIFIESLLKANLSNLSLKLVENRLVSVKDGFDIFKNTSKILILEILKFIIWVVLIQLVSIPVGIVFDSIYQFVSSLSNTDVYMIDYTFVSGLISYVLVEILLSQKYYILSDLENIDTIGILDKSMELIKKNVFKYIKFEISFIGWFLVSIVTLGVGFLFLAPYKTICEIYFYQEIKEDKLIEYNNTEKNRNTKDEVVLDIALVAMINFFVYFIYKIIYLF